MNIHPSSWLLRNKTQSYRPPANLHELDTKEYYQQMIEDSKHEYKYIFDDFFSRPVYDQNKANDWTTKRRERQNELFFSPKLKMKQNPLTKRNEQEDTNLSFSPDSEPPSSINLFAELFQNQNQNQNKSKLTLDLSGLQSLQTIVEKEKELQSVVEKEKEKEKESETLREKKTTVSIQRNIQTLHDLIQLTADYPYDPEVEYNICIESLHKIKEPLIELNDMIGLQHIKTNVLNQILYFLQGFHKGPQTQSEYMHTVIYGPPGTGKTEIAKIIGKIFSQLGILSKGIFKKVTRSELVAGYLGQTALKTQALINECLGGCLFIDEAYALGNQENKDSFSKECIDTLCEALSDHKDDLMVIIAGYEKELNECFFSYNQGLESRFIWRYFTEPYSADELRQIFCKKVRMSGWTLYAEKMTVDKAWFETRRASFVYNGRDMESLLTKVKIAHSKRVFSLDNKEKRIINEDDIENGYASYLKNEDGKKRIEEKERKLLVQSMYI